MAAWRHIGGCLEGVSFGALLPGLNRPPHNLSPHMESHIETAMLEAMARAFWPVSVDFVDIAGGEMMADTEAFIYIAAQVPYFNYTLDFYVYAIGPDREVQIDVECDGHDFHDATKAQAMRDRRRDRFVQRGGFEVLRFTGSEIANNADGCVAEIVAHIRPLFIKDETWAA